MTTNITEDPAPAPLATCTIHTSEGDITVPCEPINDYLAITAEFFMAEDGSTILSGLFGINHRPSGRMFTEGTGCIWCARSAGKAIAALDIDWSGLTEDRGAEWSASLDEDTRTELGILRALAWSCDAGPCHGEDD